jgi:hypothetical protein
MQQEHAAVPQSRPLALARGKCRAMSSARACAKSHRHGATAISTRSTAMISGPLHGIARY